MHIIVINLRSAPDRLRFMDKQLGGRFQRLDAVYGANVPTRLAANFGDSRRYLIEAEIGCYASHLLAAEQILGLDLPYAVILEDDVEIDCDFREVIQQSSEILAKWDLISLSGAKQRPHFPIAHLSGGRSLVRYVHLPKTSAAYVLSNSGSRKLLNLRARRRPIDVDIRYGWEMGLDGYGIFPPPAQQSGLFASSIPKPARRVYWRSNPLGYVAGRISMMRRLGVLNTIRALAAR